MLTGRQIREARTLLALTRSQLAYKVKRITTLAIMRAEENEDEPVLSPDQATAVLEALEKAGIAFTPDGPRLRTTHT